MKKSVNNFLQEIQALDEPAKNRILVVATGLVMAVVIYAWLGYVNGVVVGSQQPAEVAAQPAPTPALALAAPVASGDVQKASVDGSGFWASVGAGFNDVMALFKGSRQYTIQPQ